MSFSRKAVFAVLLGLAAWVRAEEPRERQAVSLLIENDMLFDTDRYYTNGFSIAWSRVQPPRSWLKEIAARVGYHRNVLSESHGLEIGQVMSTPANIQLTTPQPDDRPWAGLLFFGPTLQLDVGKELDVFKMFLGVSGPWSLADRTQAQWHRFIKVKTPKGWAHQLENEPEFGFIYEHRWRLDLLTPEGDWNLELIPKAGFHLGTVLDKVDLGAQVRFGWHVPRDFGTSLIGTSGNLPPTRFTGKLVTRRNGFGAHLFASARGSAVFRNLFLDGSTFRSGPSVQREAFTGSLEWGLALTNSRFRVTITSVYQSREFVGQIRAQKFSSLNLAYFW
ncbi:MAG: lipid A deacylase LpxR family protein [Opitutae bacterium]|nr:lipid A deacylase LpxR family protein [Opitutae bacterium]